MLAVSGAEGGGKRSVRCSVRQIYPLFKHQFDGRKSCSASHAGCRGGNRNVGNAAAILSRHEMCRECCAGARPCAVGIPLAQDRCLISLVDTIFARKVETHVVDVNKADAR